MHTICFIIPYYTLGKDMPSEFSLWLKTASFNSQINFLLFTDADMSKYDIPQNVDVHKETWEDMQKRIENKYVYNLEKPYKLCDFKPAYGELFSEYLRKYDFWGHCDIDLFWGDIRAFITDDILEQNERIGMTGPCSIYKNSERVNGYYRELPSVGNQKWDDVIHTSENRCFDEWAGHCGGGISQIMHDNGIAYYDIGEISSDLYAFSGKLKTRKTEQKHLENIYFELDNGKCYVCAEGKRKYETMYVHFQKRRCVIQDKKIENHWYLFAPNIISREVGGISVLKCFKFEIRQFIFRVKRKFRKEIRRFK